MKKVVKYRRVVEYDIDAVVAAKVCMFINILTAITFGLFIGIDAYLQIVLLAAAGSWLGIIAIYGLTKKEYWVVDDDNKVS